MDPSEMQPEKEELRCLRHGEKCHYFCDVDGKFLCVVCCQSKDHKTHNATLIEEAAQSYQEISKGEKFYVVSTKTQLNNLRKLKDSLKSRQCLPPGQLLQDIKIALCRSEGFRFLNPTPVSMGLEKKLSDIKSRHDSLTESLKRFKVDRTTKSVLPNPKLSVSLGPLFRSRNTPSFVSYSSNLDSSENLGSPGATNIEELKTVIDPLILDAASAHPDLIISQDMKTVTLMPVLQSVCAEPTDPERFYPFRCVLGLPGLCSGCQTWEAELQGPGGGGCVVGVASEPVPRKGMLQIEPLSGFWALRIAGSECQALTGAGTREDLSVCPRKVGVRVNHECGEVVFCDATTSNHLYTFHASFPGQIFPFFRLLFPGTQITLSP
ncbi:hypothetical protein Celaphus_00014499 [Cervus elaphus hippelaphus]|uniref:B box-type domain-containing protein n=1 Tax=Cervus elaphus hippelaphus TaxID=46360 RepID=A0A212D525_CEREH|nr:hypothetical protein Celaphus_00014499 [Cervus elaphus hippelaphus]